MARQFNQASDQALNSIQVLKTAGVDADRQIKEAAERARALRDDLAAQIDRGQRLAERLERGSAAKSRSSNTDHRSGAAGPDQTPSGSAAGHSEQYRSEIEQALAQVIRSTAAAG